MVKLHRGRAAVTGVGFAACEPDNFDRRLRRQPVPGSFPGVVGNAGSHCGMLDMFNMFDFTAGRPSFGACPKPEDLLEHSVVALASLGHTTRLRRLPRRLRALPVPLGGCLAARHAVRLRSPGGSHGERSGQPGNAPRETERLIGVARMVSKSALLPCVGPCAIAAAALSARSHAGAVDPYADAIIDYVQGTNATPGYTFASAALGEPSRFTGEGIFPSVVTPFSPPFMNDEIVSIGVGGWLVIEFDEPIVDDPSNPHGIDFIIFGNSGFIDGAFPDGVVDGLFSDDGGVVEVSADGVRWTPIPGALADGLFPTLGWLDAGPFDATPGVVASDFTKPVDPTLSLRDVLGLDYPSLLAVYDGAGGGSGVELTGTGLGAISFVRISVPADGLFSVEIDAIVDVVAARPSPDLDGDGAVDGADLGLLLAAWGTTPGTRGIGDLDGSGLVDGGDLGILLAAWSAGGSP